MCVVYVLTHDGSGSLVYSFYAPSRTLEDLHWDGEFMWANDGARYPNVGRMIKMDMGGVR